MKPLTPKLLKILTFMGLFCLVIPFSIVGIWVHAFNLGDNQAERISIFNTYFPDFLHGIYSTTLVSIVFCVAAIILSIICLKVSGKLWKILNIAILVISISLFLLNLISMM
jgi:hypothetical protein